MNVKVSKTLNIIVTVFIVITVFTIMAVPTNSGAEGSGGSTNPEGMVSYWRFEESSGTTAIDSAGVNHGTIYGATQTTGRVGNALNFDGVNDYVDCGDAPSLNPTKAISLEAWIMTNRITDDGTPQSYQTIVSKFWKNGYFLRINPGGRIGFGVTSIRPISLQTEPVLEVGQWYHVAGTYDWSSGLSIYINGQLIDNAGYDGNVTNVNSYLTMGAWTESHLSNFDGVIDEVAIYNRALSEEEITHHYNNGLAGIGYFESYHPKDLKQDAITQLEEAKTGDKKIDKKIDKAIDHIQKSLNINPKNPDKPWKKHSLWVDDDHLDPKHGKKVFDEEKKAVKYLQKLIKDKKVPDSVKDVCREVIDKLVTADELLAGTALEEAKTYEGSDKKVDKVIEKAEKELGKAEKELGKGKPDKAIDHYKKAWQHAQKAI